jgi:hypothetical protein
MVYSSQLLRIVGYLEFGRWKFQKSKIQISLIYKHAFRYFVTIKRTTPFRSTGSVTRDTISQEIDVNKIKGRGSADDQT